MLKFLKDLFGLDEVKSGDKYTAEWWQINLNYDTKQATVIKLNNLVKQGVLEKVRKDEYEIVRFVPTGCEDGVFDIIENLRRK